MKVEDEGEKEVKENEELSESRRAVRGEDQERCTGASRAGTASTPGPGCC